MVFRIKLPKDVDCSEGLTSDSAAVADTDNPDSNRKHVRPSDCVGCMPLVNMDITAAVITAFLK